KRAGCSSSSAWRSSSVRVVGMGALLSGRRPEHVNLARLPGGVQMRKWLNFLGWPAACGILAGLLLVAYLPPKGGPVQVPPSSAGSGPWSYADAVGRAAPAVVNIYTSKTVRTPLNPLYDDPFFRHFLNRGTSRQQERIQRSLGSAEIIHKGGYILTNHHVIRGVDEILLQLYDGREALARAVGLDPQTDLAALKIDLPILQP